MVLFLSWFGCEVVEGKGRAFARPPTRSVFARQVDGVAGEPEGDFGEWKVCEGNVLFVDLPAVSVLTGKDCRVVAFIDFQRPDLERLGGDLLVVRLDDRDLVEQPVSAACIGNVLGTIGEKHLAVNRVPIPFLAA